MSTGAQAWCSRCERSDVPTMNGANGLRLRGHDGRNGFCLGSGQRVHTTGERPPNAPVYFDPDDDGRETVRFSIAAEAP